MKNLGQNKKPREGGPNNTLGGTIQQGRVPKIQAAKFLAFHELPHFRVLRGDLSLF